MKAGGLAFITLQARWFLDKCRDLRDKPDQIHSFWHELLSKAFVDHDDALARYDRGEFLYAPNPRAPMNGKFYGEAVVPYRYIEATWSDSFEILDFVADQSRFEQAIRCHAKTNVREVPLSKGGRSGRAKPSPTRSPLRTLSAGAESD